MNMAGEILERNRLVIDGVWYERDEDGKWWSEPEEMTPKKMCALLNRLLAECKARSLAESVVDAADEIPAKVLVDRRIPKWLRVRLHNLGIAKNRYIGAQITEV